MDGIFAHDGRVRGVQTGRGDIRAEHVVLCGGMWTREIGLRSGVSLPLYPVEHHYVVTGPVPGAFDELPVGRDSDLCLYFRGEGDAIMLSARSRPLQPPGTSRPFPPIFPSSSCRPIGRSSSTRCGTACGGSPPWPIARSRCFVNGPESFTPDNNFLLGETPELKNLYVAAGFNSAGIVSAGGAGKYLAEWIIEGQPTMDLWSVDVRRFGPHANNRSFLRSRVTEVLGLHYQLAWPNREFETGRGLRTSPLHQRMAEEGASFGAKAGWERPNWFSGPGGPTRMEYSFGKQNWWKQQAAEHRAARENVAVFEQSAFGKLLVTGRDAVRALQRICANHLDVPLGKAIYTAMLNRRGGFESDMVVTRTGPQEFYLITGTAQAVHDRDWIESSLLPEEHVAVVDVTESWAVLGLMGPRSRELLAGLTDADLSNAAFPFATARRIDVGPASVWAVRVTYVGELGWELHVPASQAVGLYDALRDAGRDFNLRPAGHYAINSLRLEKGYRAGRGTVAGRHAPGGRAGLRDRLEARLYRARGLAAAAGRGRSTPAGDLRLGGPGGHRRGRRADPSRRRRRRVHDFGRFRPFPRRVGGDGLREPQRTGNHGVSRIGPVRDQSGRRKAPGQGVPAVALRSAAEEDSRVSLMQINHQAPRAGSTRPDDR